jgi:hypothetical protein
MAHPRSDLIKYILLDYDDRKSVMIKRTRKGYHVRIKLAQPITVRQMFLLRYLLNDDLARLINDIERYYRYNDHEQRLFDIKHFFKGIKTVRDLKILIDNC